jgi:hypothetical protein
MGNVGNVDNVDNVGIALFLSHTGSSSLPPPHREAMPPEPRSGDIIVKKNPTARRGSSRKIKTYYEKTGTKIYACILHPKAHLGCGG